MTSPTPAEAPDLGGESGAQTRADLWLLGGAPAGDFPYLFRSWPQPANRLMQHIPGDRLPRIFLRKSIDSPHHID